ncbi:uncharacterized protein LOC114542079 [Dendronephthya gigantea]|uniref:uncharacterized protein LOC114542079 n=1 Tax=Dendronephthya gigantea TaxID=151771 RepID=UPI00106A9DEC|nr:uncharacterized protein LOC114542079 [Dendronephthya gigantea]
MDISQQRLEKINAGVFASLHERVKQELREEFQSLITTEPQKSEATKPDDFSTMLNRPERKQSRSKSLPRMSTPYAQVDIKENPECYGTATRTADSSGRPVQKPAVFDGRTPWEAYKTQFEIVAEINRWDGTEKAAFLATSLRGQALTVLSNLPPESRVHYPSLVAALESRFGSQRQAELHRMKLRSRVRHREESLPELAQDIERLAKLAYPNASPAVLETLTKDQFIDALTDDELRLRVAQARPSSLRAALGVSLEVESFTLAAKRRTKFVRTVRESPRNGTQGDMVSEVDASLQKKSRVFS